MEALKHMVKPNFIIKQGRNIGESGLHGREKDYCRLFGLMALQGPEREIQKEDIVCVCFQHTPRCSSCSIYCLMLSFFNGHPRLYCLALYKQT
jgi:hypothetical protein